MRITESKLRQIIRKTLMREESYELGDAAMKGNGNGKSAARYGSQSPSPNEIKLGQRFLVDFTHNLRAVIARRARSSQLDVNDIQVVVGPKSKPLEWTGTSFEAPSMDPRASFGDFIVRVFVDPTAASAIKGRTLSYDVIKGFHQDPDEKGGDRPALYGTESAFYDDVTAALEETRRKYERGWEAQKRDYDEFESEMRDLDRGGVPRPDGAEPFDPDPTWIKVIKSIGIGTLVPVSIDPPGTLRDFITGNINGVQMNITYGEA